MISDNAVWKKTIFTIWNISAIAYRDMGIHNQAENQTRYPPSPKQQRFSVNIYKYTYLHASSSGVQWPQDMEYIFNILSAVISWYASRWTVTHTILHKVSTNGTVLIQLKIHIQKLGMLSQLF